MVKTAFIFCSISLFCARLSAQSETKDFAAADTLVTQQKFAASIILFDKLISVYGEKEKYLTGRGFAYMQLGDIAKSKADYKTALVLNPNCSKCIGNLGIIESDQRNFSVAIKYFNQYTKLEPAKAMGYVKRGEAEFQLGKYETAITDFNKGLEQDVNSPYIYLWRSMTELAQGSATAALEDINRSIEYQPSVEYAYYIRAKIYIALERYTDAKADLFKVLQKNPSFSEYHIYAGIALYNLGESAKALEALNEAISLDANNYLPFLYRSYILYNYAQFENACADKQKAKELKLAAEGTQADVKNITIQINTYCNSTTSNYYYQRGNTFFTLGQFDKSIAIYIEGLQKFPDDPALLEGKGNAALALSKFQAALTSYYACLQNINKFDASVATSGQNTNKTTATAFFTAQLYNSMAWAEANLQHIDTAIMYQSKAIIIIKQTPAMYNQHSLLSDYLVKRAALYVSQKEYKEATVDVDEALQLNPSVIAYLGKASLLINKNVIGNASLNVVVTNQLTDHTIYPTSPAANWNRAEVLSAINYCDKAINIAPDAPMAYLLRAQAGIILKKDDYCADVKKAEATGIVDAAKLLQVDCK